MCAYVFGRNCLRLLACRKASSGIASSGYDALLQAMYEGLAAVGVCDMVWPA